MGRLADSRTETYINLYMAEPEGDLSNSAEKETGGIPQSWLDEPPVFLHAINIHYLRTKYNRQKAEEMNKADFAARACNFFTVPL